MSLREIETCLKRLTGCNEDESEREQEITENDILQLLPKVFFFFLLFQLFMMVF